MTITILVYKELIIIAIILSKRYYFSSTKKFAIWYHLYTKNYTKMGAKFTFKNG